MASNNLSTKNTLLSSLTQTSSLLSSSYLSSGLTSSSLLGTSNVRKRNSDISSGHDTKKPKETVSNLSEGFSANLRLTSTSLNSALLQSSLLKSSFLTSATEKPNTNFAESHVGKLKVKLEVDEKPLKVKSHKVQSSCLKVVKPFVQKLSPDSGKVAKKRVKKSDKSLHERVVKYHSIEYPEYDLHRDSVITGIHRPKFIPPHKDRSLQVTINKALADINGIKLGLINAVSASLISQPNFKDRGNRARIDLAALTERVVPYDPEFVLKVALYSRKELNIRTTSNFLLALAANVSACRPYLKKYFSASINLPSDWIEVAEIYQAFHDETIMQGALPAALRRCMIAKFPDFDQYQLAKYNKDSSKNKKKNTKKAGVGSNDKGGKQGEPETETTNMEVNYDEKIETEEELEKISFTLKRLIRKLHITEPVENVMCLIGKKYPDNLEEFYKCRLPGTWDEERAGKRMKLPVPETWETQVSLKGNKASTWEQLLDNKKLPFMAMLRNLRNLIKAGISAKHHGQVIRRLTDERQVVNSKQFPFRFFSAYEALTQLSKEYEDNQAQLITEAEQKASGIDPPTITIRGRGRGGGRGRGRGRGRGGSGAGAVEPKGTGAQWWLNKKNKKKTTKEVPYDPNIIKRYKKALDTAVQIATVYNVQPIKGSTWIFCNVGSDMAQPCTSARGLGKPKTKKEVAILMGLMCKYSCEDCEMFIYNNQKYDTVSLTKGTILDNMDNVLQAATNLSKDGTLEGLNNDLPYKLLYEALVDRQQIDNIIILSPSDFNLDTYLPIYRRLVNPNLLYASISFSAGRASFSSIIPTHDNDIYIAGYSDSILRYIAEKGDGGQLLHVNNIDEAYHLKPMVTVGLETIPEPELVTSPDRPLPIASNTPRWRTARVFISSTFRDMHGERDLLTRFVFPELRDRGLKHFINIYEVDLRWGVTEEQTRNQRTLTLCLQEIKKCQFFLGILGERYGWMPEKYDVPDTAEYDWVRQHAKGASVTELEMEYGALQHVAQASEKAFFFLRDNSFEKDIPREFLPHFVAENDDTMEKMNKLKRRIHASGLEVYDNYPCRWGGLVNDKAIVAGLESFGLRVINNLWTAIKKSYPDETAMLDEETHISKLHQAFIEDKQQEFIGRKALIKQCINKIINNQHGLLAIVGKSGCGKTSLMSRIVYKYLEHKHCTSPSNVIVHVVGAAPGSTNIAATIRRLTHHINTQFSLNFIVPEDFRNLVIQFAEILKEAGKVCHGKLILFLDGIDNMDDVHQPYSMEWLPSPIPQNVTIVISVQEDNKAYKSLKRLAADEFTVTPLDMFDKSEIIRKTLEKHRKQLDESPFNNQLKLLVSKKEAPNPLYLKLACDELRVFGVFEKISQKIKSLPHTTPQLLQEILVRLETDHDKDLVCIALSLLVVVRDGLIDEELCELISWKKMFGKQQYNVKDIVNMTLPYHHLLPPIVFSYLKRSIQSFLNPTGKWNTRLELAHIEIINAVRQRYLKGSGADLEPNLHKLIAGYYYKKADPNKNGTFTGTDVRAFSQLTYHMACSGNFNELEEIVCNLCYVNQKCQLGLASQLIEDYVPKGTLNKSSEREQIKFFAKPKVLEYKSFISRNIHILTSHPALTWQQALNEPDTSIVNRDARDWQTHEDVDIDPCLMSWINKPNKVDPCYQTISNLKEPVTCVAISSDNLYFATGSLDCIVRLYDLQTGKEIRMFCGHSDPISDVCFAGKTVLCSASYDNTISLWNVDGGHRIAVLKNHKRRVNSCAADPSGKVVATASWDCTVKVWNTNNGEQACYLNVASPVNCVDFHPEGQLIVTGSWDSLIKIYDIFHKTRKAILRGHQTSVRDVAYSPSGRHIASASLDGEVKLWSALNGSQVGNIQGHCLPINKLTFTQTGRELVTVSDDQKVKIWSGDLGIPVHCIGSEKNGSVTSVTLSNDGEILVAGYHEGHIRAYDINTGANIYTVKHSSCPVNAVTFTADDSNILIGVDSENIMLCTRSNGQKVSVLTGHSKNVLTIAATKQYIVSGGEDFNICVYTDLYQLKTSRHVPPKAILNHHQAPVTSCTFNKSGTMFASAGRDGSVMIWEVKWVVLDPESPPFQHLLSCHSDWINGCIWSNTGNVLLTASNDFNMKIWNLNLKDGDENKTTEKVKFTGHMSAINCVDYQYGCIVSGSSDGNVKVWSHKGTEITTLYGHTQRVNDCSIHVKFKEGKGMLTEEVEEPEDEMDWATMVDNDSSSKKAKMASKLPEPVVSDVIVATCSDDGLIRVWKPLQANELASLTGHSDRVVSVATDTAGNVCSTSLDKSIRLWKPELSDIKAIGQHNSDITFTVSSKYGDIAISGSRDGTVKIWKDNGNQGKVCVCSFQADEKCVSDAVFLQGKCTRFVTVSYSGLIKIWDISNKTGDIAVKCKDEFERLPSPILSVTWSEKQPLEYIHYIWVLEWNGRVTGWNLNTKKMEYSVLIQTPELPLTSALKLKYASNSNRLMLPKVYSSLACMDLQQLKNMSFDSISVPINIDESHIAVEKREANWVLSSDIDGTCTFIGDSKGQLTRVNGHDLKSMKIHNGGINCVLKCGDYLFTASSDCLIKVWKIEAIKSWKMEEAQVGMFINTAPVLSLCQLDHNTANSIKLMCGDILGNVNLLQWNY